jgi:hypothetical protein
VLRHWLKVYSFALRARRGDVGGHRTGEVFHLTASTAAPAQAAEFFPGAQARDDSVDPVADLLQCFAERLQGWFFAHGYLAGPAARAKQRGATRRFDVKRELELLVPGSAPGEESEKLPEIAHMFNRTRPAYFASALARKETCPSGRCPDKTARSQAPGPRRIP